MKNSQLGSRALYFRLLTYVKPYWKTLALSIGLLALIAVTEPVFPALMKPLLDEGFTNRDATFIQWIPVVLVILFLVRGILGFTSKYASSWVANRVITDLRQKLFEHTIQLPSSFFDRHSSGQLSSHIANNPSAVTGAATMALTVLTRDSLTILALMAWLFWLDWKLTLITVALFPLMALVVRYFNKRMRIVSRKNQYALAGITHLIEEAVSNSRILKIFTGEAYETVRFRKASEHQRGLAMRATVAESAVTPLVQLLASLSVSFVIAIALNSTEGGQTSAGEFVSFLTALLMLLPPIKRLTDVTSVIQKGLAAADIIFGLLDEETEKTSESTQKLSSSGDINFSNVRYSYIDGRIIIDNLSLTIPAGKTYALVGKSGSGKTTLTNLLTGLYLPDSGEISIAGTPIGSVSLQELRSNISLVSQDVRLFNDTILRNVAYADPLPDEERVHAALEAAHALEFINALPEGFNTEIGQNGITLSGGQRQRIAIARAFYKDAPILILDEATSALDSESEKLIQQALSRLTQGRTSLIIAHRLSTIENADCIVVLQDGKIAESGTHKMLLEKRGLYSNYYQIQFSE